MISGGTAQRHLADVMNRLHRFPILNINTIRIGIFQQEIIIWIEPRVVFIEIKTTLNPSALYAPMIVVTVQQVDILVLPSQREVDQGEGIFQPLVQIYIQNVFLGQLLLRMKKSLREEGH